MNIAKIISLLILPIPILIGNFVALAESQGSTTPVSLGGFPFFILAAELAILIRWLFFIPACLSQGERLFDITGSITSVLLAARVTIISPLFVTLLLTHVSGFPLLEKKADKKWGSRADYEEYKNNTSALILGLS